MLFKKKKKSTSTQLYNLWQGNQDFTKVKAFLLHNLSLWLLFSVIFVTVRSKKDLENLERAELLFQDQKSRRQNIIGATSDSFDSFERRKQMSQSQNSPKKDGREVKLGTNPGIFKRVVSIPHPYPLTQTLKSEWRSSGIVVQRPSSLASPVLRLLEWDSGITTSTSYSTFLKHCFDSVYTRTCPSLIYDGQVS